MYSVMISRTDITGPKRISIFLCIVRFATLNPLDPSCTNLSTMYNYTNESYKILEVTIYYPVAAILLVASSFRSLA